MMQKRADEVAVGDIIVIRIGVEEFMRARVTKVEPGPRSFENSIHIHYVYSHTDTGQASESDSSIWPTCDPIEVWTAP